MASSSFNSFNNGSLNKPPTLVREEFAIWKSRMIAFLDCIDLNLYQAIVDGPISPTVVLPAVPATETSLAVPARTVPKELKFWSDDELKQASIDRKAKNLLIMALPNDIFHSVINCKSAKELWDTLVVLFEGTKQVKKNKKSHLIQEYENFKAKTEESLTQTYDRFNCLINDLIQHGVEKENEEKLIKFLSCLPEEWETLSLVIQNSKDLEATSLQELYGNLLTQEKRITQKVKPKGDSLALVTENKRSKEKVLISEVDQDVESMSSDDLDLSELGESLALITRKYNKFIRRNKKGESSQKSFTRKDDHVSNSRDKSKEKCYKCNKLGHYASDCKSKPQKTSEKDAKYYKRKYKARYQKKDQKGFVAEQECWSDSSTSSSDSEDEVAHFCLMASGSDSPSTSTSTSENCQVFDFNHLSISDCRKALLEMSLEKIKISERLEKITLQKADLERQLRDCHQKIKDYNNERSNLLAENDILNKERRQLYAELQDNKMYIKSWTESQKISERIIVSQQSVHDKTGLGFNSETNSFRPIVKNEVLTVTEKTSEHLSEESSGKSSEESVCSPDIPSEVSSNNFKHKYTSSEKESPAMSHVSAKYACIPRPILFVKASDSDLIDKDKVIVEDWIDSDDESDSITSTFVNSKAVPTKTPVISMTKIKAKCSDYKMTSFVPEHKLSLKKLHKNGSAVPPLCISNGPEPKLKANSKNPKSINDKGKGIADIVKPKKSKKNKLADKQIGKRSFAEGELNKKTSGASISKTKTPSSGQKKKLPTNDKIRQQCKSSTENKSKHVLTQKNICCTKCGMNDHLATYCKENISKEPDNAVQTWVSKKSHDKPSGPTSPTNKKGPIQIWVPKKN